MLAGISAGYDRDPAGLQLGGVAFCFVAAGAVSTALPLSAFAALQGAIQAGDNSEIARLKQEVGAVLAEHRALTDEYKRLKAQRPDWKTPERSG